MTQHYEIIYQDELSLSDKTQMIEGLNQNAFQQKLIGKDNGSFSFVIKDDHKNLLAGITGFYYYGCFHIDLLYVKEECRNKGLGSLLLEKSELLAYEKNCLFMVVNTMDFEAGSFYKKHGFVTEFIRAGFEKNATMLLMRKSLLNQREFYEKPTN